MCLTNTKKYWGKNDEDRRLSIEDPHEPRPPKFQRI